MAQDTQVTFKTGIPQVTLASKRTLRGFVLGAPLLSLAVLGASWLGVEELSAGQAVWALLPLALVALGFLKVSTRADGDASACRLGPYTLSEKIGEGGMGVVYKANHALLRRPAAIKLLPVDRAGDRELERFEREVQLTSMLTHPNTISIYDFGRTDQGTFYYAMEYLDGLDLQTLVERHGPQEPARVAHLLAQLAGALQEAHSVGLIHRDVKPANVMLCERGGTADVVKVLDFGLIKQISGGDGTQSDVHHVVGTPLYLSPEALVSPERVDAKSDLYAVGAVGYFLLTGAPPFGGKNLLEICGHHLHSQPAPPSERLGAPIPSELEALIMSCLAKSPADRPASAAELQSALLAFAAAWTQERAHGWWAEHGRDAAAPAPESARTLIESTAFATALAA